VLKLESRDNPETIRMIGSSWARRGDAAAVFADTSPFLAEFSAGKRSVGLALKQPAGWDAARRLIARSDVVLTNLSAPAVRRLHLTYDEVRVARPDIIYIGMPGFGFDEDLPYHRFVSWGPNQAPLVGLDELTGEPDREPPGITSTAPPDYIGGLHATMAVLAALEHRDATGEGSFFDISQFHASASLLGAFLADFELSSRVQPRIGNRDLHAAPSGVYPCRGRRAFVAVTVTDDDAWSALCQVAGRPEWRADERYRSLDGRRAHQDQLDELLAGWTRSQTAEEVAVSLQEAGIAAYPVLDAPDLLADPQLRDRGWYQVRSSSRFERDVFGGHPIHLCETPGRDPDAGPSLGEHTVEVLRDVAGYTLEEIDAMVTAGAAYLPVEPERVLRRPYDAYLRALGLSSEPG
jgi:benzylsuccinate CoA-transferase BbsF subunit